MAGGTRAARGRRVVRPAPVLLPARRLRPLPHDQQPRRQARPLDHETNDYRIVADDLPALLKASNDLVERDIDRAFFFGDVVKRIFQFPGVGELHRQLDAGLSPDHTWNVVGESQTLLAEAVDKKRGDVFAALLERGADPTVALLAACRGFRLDLAEAVLRRGADPAVRLTDGQPLLQWATLSRRPRTVALLMRFGAQDRLPKGEFERIVEHVRSSDRIEERKRKQILEALGL